MPVYAIPIEMVINKEGILSLYSQLLELLWWLVGLLEAESFCSWMYSSIIWFTPIISTPCFAVSHFPWTSFVSPQVHAFIPLPDTVTSSAVGIHEAKVMRKAISLRGNKIEAPHGWMWPV